MGGFCETCGAELGERSSHYGVAQWKLTRFCSRPCAYEGLSALYFGRGLDVDAMMKEHVASFEEAGVPYGFCQCGCGAETRIAKQSGKRDRQINGEPVRFLKGHAARQLTRRDRRGSNRQMVTAGAHTKPVRWNPDAELESIR